MIRPELNKVPLSKTMHGEGKATANMTISIGQWDKFIEVAYNAGFYLIELDDQERPVAAYHIIDEDCPAEVNNECA